jgi:hypothetical protein
MSQTVNYGGYMLPKIQHLKLADAYFGSTKEISRVTDSYILH